MNKKHAPNYRRCFRCEQRAECTAMCVDVCCDEVKRIEARKQIKKEADIYQYEIARTEYIQTKSDWSRLQKKRRGY